MNLRKASVNSTSSKWSATDERLPSLKRKRPRLIRGREIDIEDAQNIDGTGNSINSNNPLEIGPCPISVQEDGMDDGDSLNEVCIMTPYVSRHCSTNMDHPDVRSNDTNVVGLNPYTPQLISPDAGRYKNSSNDSLLQSKVVGLLSDLKKDVSISPILSPRFEPAFRLTSQDYKDTDDPFSPCMTSPIQDPETTLSKITFQPKSDSLLPPWSPLFDTPEKPISVQKSMQQINPHPESSCFAEYFGDHKYQHPSMPQSRPDFRQTITQDTPLPAPEFAGFRTAKGKQVQVAESLLKQATQKFLQEEGGDIGSKMPKFIETPEREIVSRALPMPGSENTPTGVSGINSTVMGFTSARGKSITITEEKLSWARGFLEGDLHDGRPRDLSIPPQSLSQTMEMKKPNVSDDALEINGTKWGDSPMNAGMGFQSAKGKAIAVDACKMKWAKEFLNDDSRKSSVADPSLPKFSNNQTCSSPALGSPQEQLSCTKTRNIVLPENPAFSPNKPPPTKSSIISGKNKTENDLKFTPSFSRASSSNLSTNIHGKKVSRGGFKSPSRLISPSARITSTRISERDPPARTGWTSSGKLCADLANRARKPYRLNELATGNKLFSGFSKTFSFISE
jgi:hypothetical protein